MVGVTSRSQIPSLARRRPPCVSHHAPVRFRPRTLTDLRHMQLCVLSHVCFCIIAPSGASAGPMRSILQPISIHGCVLVRQGWASSVVHASLAPILLDLYSRNRHGIHNRSACVITATFWPCLFSASLAPAYSFRSRRRQCGALARRSPAVQRSCLRSGVRIPCTIELLLLLVQASMCHGHPSCGHPAMWASNLMGIRSAGFLRRYWRGVRRRVAPP